MRGSNWNFSCITLVTAANIVTTPHKWIAFPFSAVVTSGLYPSRPGAFTHRSPVITAGFLYRAGAENPLNFREKFRVCPRTILENFSGWIPKPQFWYPPLRFGYPNTYSVGFLGIHSRLWFFCWKTKSFGYFPEVCIKTLPSCHYHGARRAV